MEIMMSSHKLILKIAVLAIMIVCVVLLSIGSPRLPVAQHAESKTPLDAARVPGESATAQLIQSVATPNGDSIKVTVNQMKSCRFECLQQIRNSWMSFPIW
jgi:hypothetical protein